MAVASKTWYQWLRIDAQADTDQVIAAYQRAYDEACQMVESPVRTDILWQLDQARVTLADPLRRAVYDARLAAGDDPHLAAADLPDLPPEPAWRTFWEQCSSWQRTLLLGIPLLVLLFGSGHWLASRYQARTVAIQQATAPTEPRQDAPSGRNPSGSAVSSSQDPRMGLAESLSGHTINEQKIDHLRARMVEGSDPQAPAAHVRINKAQAEARIRQVEAEVRRAELGEAED